MRNLSEILNESIFDNDLATNEEYILVKNWANTYFLDDHGNPQNVEIDMSSKKIIFKDISYGRWDSLYVSTNQPFKSFIPGFQLVHSKGGLFNSIVLEGNICGVGNLPKQFDDVHLYPNPKTHAIDKQVFKDLTKYASVLKSLGIFGGYNYNIKREVEIVNLDLSDLKINIKNSLSLYNVSGDIKFNTDLKTNILSFGYKTLDTVVENLPIFKTLSFKFGNFETITKWMDKIQDTGKSNFDSVKINCKDLSIKEKDMIISFMKGESNEFNNNRIELLNKIKRFNDVLNEKDGTKDRFGCSLEEGDIVVLCDSSSPNFPSRIDIYKGCSSNGRIRTETQMMVPPRNIIKLNNPKLQELLK